MGDRLHTLVRCAHFHVARWCQQYLMHAYTNNIIILHSCLHVHKILIETARSRQQLHSATVCVAASNLCQTHTHTSMHNCTDKHIIPSHNVTHHTHTNEIYGIHSVDCIVYNMEYITLAVRQNELSHFTAISVGLYITDRLSCLCV